MSPIITFAIPFFVVTVILEAVVMRGKKEVRGYELKDTFASLAMGVGSLVAKLPTIAIVYAVNLQLYEHRIVDWPQVWWVWPVALIAEDFCYYWFHRSGHEVRLLWAGHLNHHSSRHYNLSTALRQPWMTVLFAPIFWLPMPLLGFSPEMVLTAQSISLVYQYWIHTELIGSMGPYGWIFNTPSHHRVHHGRNPIYLDRNHGGILIIWDRFFGSFERESEPVDYGLTTNIQTFNPFRIAFHEYRAMIKDVASARKPSHVLGYLFAGPGWSPDGSRKTSRQMRAEDLGKAA